MPTRAERDDWVPADQRVLGFDKRTLLPGVVALVIWFLWAHAMPWVNDQIDFDNPVEVGDVVDLGDRELTFVPTPGWDLEDGILVSEETAVAVSLGTGSARVAEDQITFEVHTAPFDGTADELLDQVLDLSDVLDEILAEDIGDRVSFANVDGEPGELATFTGYDVDGFIATYVFDTDSGTIGVEVTVRAGADAEESLGFDVAEMLTSITYRPAAADEEVGS